MSLFRISGYVSLVLGIVCCLMLLNPGNLFYTLLSAIVGFIFATINIYQNAKYEYSKFSLGYIGMILCSVPVIFLMYIIFSH